MVVSWAAGMPIHPSLPVRSEIAISEPRQRISLASKFVARQSIRMHSTKQVALKGDISCDLTGKEDPAELAAQGPTAATGWVKMLAATETREGTTVDYSAKLAAARKIGRFAMHLPAFTDNLSKRSLVASGAVEALLKFMHEADGEATEVDEARAVCLQALCNLTASTPEAKAAVMASQGGLDLIIGLTRPAAAEAAEPPAAEPAAAAAEEPPPDAEAASLNAGDDTAARSARVRLRAACLLYNLANLNEGSTTEIHYAMVTAGAMDPLVGLTRSTSWRDHEAGELAERLISMLKAGYHEAPTPVEEKMGCQVM